jgi:phosphate transport system substrate-binding protein
MTNRSISYVCGLVATLTLAIGGCSKKSQDNGDPGAQGKEPSGEKPAAGQVIEIDGSSTVFPITQAMAEEFEAANKTKVTIGVSGTGGGFKKFCRGELAIAGASRPIKKEEADACASGKIEYIELPVAYDGLAVIVHKDNDWVESMTVAELKTMWAPEADGKVTNWNQVRQGWPNKKLNLYGPGVDSGTYDYFTKAVNGTEHASRGDFTSSEDDNVLVTGVSGDPGALGYFGYAYYLENKDKLKLIPIDDGDDANGKGPITPSPETVANGTYQPLSRPIFIYVSKAAVARPEVKAFVDFYLGEGTKLVGEVGYIPLPDKVYELARKRFADGKTGSAFAGGSQIGSTVEAVLSGS